MWFNISGRLVSQSQEKLRSRLQAKLTLKVEEFPSTHRFKCLATRRHIPKYSTPHRLQIRKYLPTSASCFGEYGIRVQKITAQIGYDLLIREYGYIERDEIPLQITPAIFRATEIISKKHSIFCSLRKLLECFTQTTTGL
jgi:hypothetical protein